MRWLSITVRILLVIISLSITGPIIVLLLGQVKLNADYRTADRSSAHLTPEASQVKEALVQVYAARAFSWRGMFALHTWIAIKPANAKEYRIYQVVGWRQWHGLPVMMAQPDIPDRYWFGHKPQIIFELRGKRAEEVIPQIMEVAEQYPYKAIYKLWPGPNSNTFVAYIIRRVPLLDVNLPGLAIGKDYLIGDKWFALTPSHTGYQISLSGYFGVALAKEEGLQINFLGQTFGVNPWRLAAELPGIGRVSLLN